MTILAALVACFRGFLALIGEVARIVPAISQRQGGSTDAFLHGNAISHDHSPFPDYSVDTESLFFLAASWGSGEKAIPATGAVEGSTRQPAGGFGMAMENKK
ncbi:hypothetical protein ACM0P6_01595 [Komagataeibacter sucrofermentans]|uniref:hypothetical protein n=1 Tax=Komagataeibacter sucrofermentans TaxID=1053551 RepID=UPI00142D6302|nr:hypothetical protein [Komagataeibacter sucrofermentans]